VVFSTQLDISNQGTGPALKVRQFGTGDTEDVALFNAGSEGDAFKIDNAGKSYFYKDVDITGNTGIGGAPGTEKLKVTGTAYITGTTTVGSTLQIGLNDGTSTAKSIRFGGVSDDNNYEHSVIETRNYGDTLKSELILFKGDNPTTGGPDRIRLRAGAIQFDTYSSNSTDRTAENIRMTINSSGNVGIGTTTPTATLDVSGTIKGYGTIPIGGIIMWNGSVAPDGWSLCDGTNETPDLRGRFIMSTTYDSTITVEGETSIHNIQGTGGKQRVVLGVNEMPSHKHTIDTVSFTGNASGSGNTTSTGGHGHSVRVQKAFSFDWPQGWGKYANGSQQPFIAGHRNANLSNTENDGTQTGDGQHSGYHANKSVDGDGAHNHNVSVATGKSQFNHTHNMQNTGGNGVSHENMPPYYILAFIQRII
jgi:microcystin-dependent protein